MLGTLIGDRYRLLSVLGTGGMGTVYLAEHVLMEKKVALKVLHPTLAVVGRVMERFQHEAVALSRIDHPNVVNATDFGKLPNGAYYLALQYVEGADLSQVLAQEGALAPDRAANIALQIARALAAAHAEGIIHRDLKPHNVMLTRGPDGQELAKVLDFGLAKLRSKRGDEPSINTGAVFGTPHYISPEQLAGARLDGRSDLYSLGVLLYEMLSGTRPFDGKDIRDVLRRQVTESASPLPQSIPDGLRQLVERLMQKDAELRPADATLVASTLQALISGSGETPTSWFVRPVTLWKHEIPTWVLLVPVGAFLVLFVLGTVFTMDDEFEAAPVAASSTGQASLSAEPEIPEPDTKLQLMSRAEFGDEQALVELEKVPAAQRSEDEWLVLAEGHMKLRRLARAIELYREAIAHRPTLSESEKISENVRIALKDPQTATNALALAADSMGERGVNILFSTWADTARRSPTSALAQRYLEEERVLQKASPAVRLALQLRETHSCEATRKLLEDARQFGDTRSLRPMAKLRAVKGCGRAQASDCYPCLRQDSLLEDAILASAKRIAPKG